MNMQGTRGPGIVDVFQHDEFGLLRVVFVCSLRCVCVEKLPLPFRFRRLLAAVAQMLAMCCNGDEVGGDAIVRHSDGGKIISRTAKLEARCCDACERIRTFVKPVINQ